MPVKSTAFGSSERLNSSKVSSVTVVTASDGMLSVTNSTRPRAVRGPWYSNDGLKDLPVYGFRSATGR